MVEPSFQVRKGPFEQPSLTSMTFDHGLILKMHHPDAFLNGRPAPLPDTAAWPSRCRASGTGGCRRHPPYRPRSWTGSLRRPGGSCLQICRLHRVCPASKAGNCYLPTITIGTGGGRRQTGCLSWSGVMGRRRKPRSMCSLDRNDGAIAAGSLRGVSRLRKGQTECIVACRTSGRRRERPCSARKVRTNDHDHIDPSGASHGRGRRQWLHG